MYLGIDLGTSNSAVVGYRDGKIELYKTVGGEDILPSVVMRDRSGSSYVGKRAYDQLQVSPQGIASKFKRLLGTSTVLPFGDGDDVITPEEASAEVLGQLLKQVHARVGEVAVDGAVITVPAAFNQMQSEATIKAANAAGLSQVGLLQEPIAAALACLERPGSKSGLFLIYDLGGGTFDVALVRAVNGSVSIEAHEGINMLGGSDFDRMLVDTIVRPWLEQNFKLSQDSFQHPEIRRLISLATANAELAKIELSSSSEAIIFVSENEARATDLDGNPIFIEVVIKREQLESLVTDRIERSVALCRKVVTDNGYTIDDIDRIVLIGGPSRMPVIRRKVPETLGVDVDHDIDPMTAVARGAVIYAEGREWAGKVSSTKKSRKKQETAAKVSYDFEARTSREKARIRVTAGEGSEGFKVSAVANDGRDYGERAVADCPVFSVTLGEGETRVNMTVVNESGVPVVDACAELLITRVAAVAAGAPCTSTIAVKVEDSDGTRAINVLEPLIEKGEVLPRQGTKVLRSARTITPGAAEWIDVELFEQAEGVPEPEANLLIGSFRLSGEDIPSYSRPLNPGEQVILHWSIDHSQLIRCSVELPDHDLHLKDHSFYVDEMAKVDFATNGKQYATDALIAASDRFDKLPDMVQQHCPEDVAELRQRLDDQYTKLSRIDDPDGFRSIAEEARLLGQDAVRLRHRPELRAAVLQHELDEAMRGARELLPLMSEEDNQAITQHHSTAGQALTEGRFQVAKRAIEEIQTLYSKALTNDPKFILGHFHHLRNERHAARDPARFDDLVKRGEAAAAAGDIPAVRSVIGDIYSVLATTPATNGDVAALAGLRR